MHAKAPQLTETEHEPQAGTFEVRTTVRRGIETPLHVLRASLEELGKEFPEQSPQTQTLERALNLIDTLERNIEVLTAIAAPSEIVPLRCTLDELARSAVRATPKYIQDCVLIAVENPEVMTSVDGPKFCGWLSNLVHACVSGQREALLRGQVEDGEAVFNLISLPRQRGGSALESAGNAFRRSEDELLLQVAEQEIVRMGGSFEHQTLDLGTNQISVRLPIEESTEGVA